MHQTPPSRRPPSARVLAHGPQLRTGGILPRAPLAPKAEGEPALFVGSQQPQPAAGSRSEVLISTSPPPLRWRERRKEEERRWPAALVSRARAGGPRFPTSPQDPALRRRAATFPPGQPERAVRAVCGSFGPPPEMGGGRGQAEAEDTEASLRALSLGDQSGRPCPPGPLCLLQD